MTDEKFEKKIELSPAWDKRDDDPKKNYGIHCVNLGFYLKGKKGVIQFILFTGWFLKQNKNKNMNNLFPMPADLGYHSYVPIYEEQESTEKCERLEGKKCYYDGSGLMADKVFDILTEKRSDGVFEYLEEEYYSRFEEKVLK